MKKFNPNSKQAIEIVRRLCAKYPKLAMKKKDSRGPTNTPCDIYEFKHYELIGNSKVLTHIFVNDFDYDLILWSYTEGGVMVDKRYKYVIPLNKDEYNEVAAIFEYAIDTAIINDLKELDFTENEITNMFRNEEETE